MDTYTDEVIDAIAAIEAQQQAMAHEAGVAAASSAALRQLHELLDRVRAALQSQGRDAGRLANVEGVTMEIERVKKLAGVTSPGFPEYAARSPAGVVTNRDTNSPQEQGP